MGYNQQKKQQKEKKNIEELEDFDEASSHKGTKWI